LLRPEKDISDVENFIFRICGKLCFVLIIYFVNFFKAADCYFAANRLKIKKYINKIEFSFLT
jgi:hypothetical protein